MIKIEIGTSSLKILGHAKSKIICAGVSAVTDMAKIYAVRHLEAAYAEIRTAFIEYIKFIHEQFDEVTLIILG